MKEAATNMQMAEQSRCNTSGHLAFQLNLAISRDSPSSCSSRIDRIAAIETQSRSSMANR